MNKRGEQTNTLSRVGFWGRMVSFTGVARLPGLSVFSGLPAIFDRRCAACNHIISGGKAAGRLCSDCAQKLAPRDCGFCKLCGLPFADGSTSLGPCQACLMQKPPWGTVYFLGSYQELLQELVLGLKFHSALFAAPLLGGLLAARISEQAEHGYDLIVPVPLHTRRLKERGYNQSLELARPIARKLATPLEPNLLLRTRHGVPQAQLNQKERRKAVKGAFIVNGSLSGERVLLVDDVMTTGATITECVCCLLGAGAGAVDVALAARTGLE